VAIGDERVALHLGLRVGRGDVLAARRDENVFLAVGDRQKAVRVEGPDVPGVQPSVLEALGGRCRVLEVPGEDVVPAANRKPKRASASKGLRMSRVLNGSPKGRSVRARIARPCLCGLHEFPMAGVPARPQRGAGSRSDRRWRSGGHCGEGRRHVGCHGDREAGRPVRAARAPRVRPVGIAVGREPQIASVLRALGARSACVSARS